MITAYVVDGELIDHTTIKLKEPIPLDNGEIKVVVEQKERKRRSRESLFGMWKGKITMSPDFNEPLDCFKEYMEWSIY